MKRFRTLRVRFALWTVGLLLAVLGIFGGFIYISFARGLYAARDDALQTNAARIITTLQNEQKLRVDEGSFVNLPLTMGDEERLERYLTVRLYTPTGELLQAVGPYRYLPVVAADLTAAQQEQSTYTTLIEAYAHDPIRVYTTPVLLENHLVGILQVAENIEEIREILDRLLKRVFVGGPALILMAALGGYWLAARALAPIDQITQTARRISAEDLSERLNLPNHEDEVSRLSATFDAMLNRLEEAFRRERQFTADASHELRTPLAAMQAILGFMRTEKRTVADYEQAMADLGEETERLRTLVENLLRLARGDLQRLAVREPVDFSALLLDVCDSLQPLAEAKGLSLTCQTAQHLMLWGDSDNLVRLLVNLVDNAIKYTEQGGIVVTANKEVDVVCVTVADTGVGMQAEHLPHIFDRFYRVERSRTTPSSGLGLAIALEIARSHGGSIEVKSNYGQGTVFTVRLPLPTESTKSNS
jgi:heavy metal sensor kinase